MCRWLQHAATQTSGAATGQLSHSPQSPKSEPRLFSPHLATSLGSQPESRLIAIYFLIAAPKDIPVGVNSRCVPCPHYKLVISTLSVAARIPGPFTASAGVSAEKNDTTIAAANMLAERPQKLHHVSTRLFVLWDKHLQRGWLVGGDTVALHLLRAYARKTEDPTLKNFDFMSLKNLGYSASSAYKVLAELNAKAADEEEEKRTSIGPYLDEIYARLLELSEKTPELNKTHALSTPFQMWYNRKCGTTITGADFDELTGSLSPPTVYTYKMKKDPGWLKWTKEEMVTFLFASGLGEILDPKAGSCCANFPTLPAGENFLASDLKILKRLITKYAANGSCFPPDKTVARLSRNQGWERRLDPFPREKCHGDHLSTLEPSCFPVQGTLFAPLLQDTDEILKKDVKLLKGKALHTVKEINDMIDKSPEGVVVFGRQPGPEALGDLSRRSRQRSQSGNKHTVDSTATAARSSDRPSTRGSASGSTTSRPLPVPATKNQTDKPVSESAQGAHGISRIRTTGSNTHPKAPQGNSTGNGQPRTSTSQSPAASVRKEASNASLRSTSSATRSIPANGGTGRPHESSTASNAPPARRQPSNSSVRTTNSVASGCTQPQAPLAQSPGLGLRKANSSLSDKTTGSKSSGDTQNLAAFNSNRQRQQLLKQAGHATAATGNLMPGQPTSSSHGTSSGAITKNPGSTSSGPAPTTSGGPELSS